MVSKTTRRDVLCLLERVSEGITRPRKAIVVCVTALGESSQQEPPRQLQFDAFTCADEEKGRLLKRQLEAGESGAVPERSEYLELSMEGPKTYVIAPTSEQVSDTSNGIWYPHLVSIVRGWFAKHFATSGATLALRGQLRDEHWPPPRWTTTLRQRTGGVERPYFYVVDVERSRLDGAAFVLIIRGKGLPSDDAERKQLIESLRTATARRSFSSVHHFGLRPLRPVEDDAWTLTIGDEHQGPHWTPHLRAIVRGWHEAHQHLSRYSTHLLGSDSDARERDE